MRLDGGGGNRRGPRGWRLPSYATQARYAEHVFVVHIGRPSCAVSDQTNYGQSSETKYFVISFISCALPESNENRILPDSGALSGRSNRLPVLLFFGSRSLPSWVSEAVGERLGGLLLPLCPS